MARVLWKTGAVLSIDTERGAFCLAQMLDDPYLAVFDIFRAGDDWPDVDLKKDNILFVNAITRQFLSLGKIRKIRIPPVAGLEVPDRRIERFPGSRKLTLWPNTPRERTIPELSSRPGGRLVRKFFDSPESGKKEVIVEDIPPDDSATIDHHEMTGIRYFRSCWNAFIRAANTEGMSTRSRT